MKKVAVSSFVLFLLLVLRDEAQVTLNQLVVIANHPEVVNPVSFKGFTLKDGILTISMPST